MGGGEVAPRGAGGERNWRLQAGSICGCARHACWRLRCWPDCFWPPRPMPRKLRPCSSTPTGPRRESCRWRGDCRRRRLLPRPRPRNRHLRRLHLRRLHRNS